MIPIKCDIQINRKNPQSIVVNYLRVVKKKGEGKNVIAENECTPIKYQIVARDTYQQKRN